MRLIDADALVNHLEEVIKKQNGKRECLRRFPEM